MSAQVMRLAPAIVLTPAQLNAVLAAVLLGLTLLSLTIGPVDLHIGEVLAALFGTGTTEEALREQIIVRDVRLPRAVLAILTGGSLGLAGAALQGLLRNPLAEPGLLGVSSSASLGAVLCLYFGVAALSPWLLPVAAMSFAGLATAVLYVIARRSAAVTLILAGIALSSLASALTSLALNLAPNPADVQDIVLWLLGSLSQRSFSDVQLCLPFVVVGAALLLACGPALDALSLGEAEARTLGVHVARLRQQVIVGTALCVGACVAITGAIGFVGLVVPHLLRPFVAYRPSMLLTSSALGGAVLLLAADLVLRAISGPQEIMLGVVTALIGAPFFFALVLSRQQRQQEGVAS
ncbi:MAG: iron ABC transporter permease [Pseudomonadota bacterium]